MAKATEPDKSRQPESSSADFAGPSPHDSSVKGVDLRRLSVQQRNAIDLLVTGQTDGEVAGAVGVTRQTVCGWRLHHPAFQAELNLRRQAAWGTAAERLRSMLPRALDALAAALDAGDTRAAIELLKLSGLTARGLEPTGPTDPDGILWARAPSDAQRLLATLDNRDVAATERELIAMLTRLEAEGESN